MSMKPNTAQASYAAFGFFTTRCDSQCTRLKPAKAAILHSTMLAPVGTAKRYEIVSPISRQTTETMAALIMTVRNVRHVRMLVTPGKTTRLEIRSDPIMRMPITMTIAVRIEITVL